MADSPNDVLTRALLSASDGLQVKILQRDVAALGGDLRREEILQQQIQQLLKRLDSDSAIDALGAPLGQEYAQGFARSPQSTVSGQQSFLAAKVPSDFGIDRDKLTSLVKAVTDPFADAMKGAESPLPYIAPKLDEAGRTKMLEAAIRGTAQGLTWDELAKEIEDVLPDAARLIQRENETGFRVQFDSGYTMSTESYSKLLARNTSVWAGNKGAIDRAGDIGAPCVIVNQSAGTCDFCLALENRVYALTAEAAAKYGVIMLAKLPNGGAPFHCNCRHVIAPFTPRKADAGSLPTADKAFETRSHAQPAAAAQAAFLKSVEENPLQYAGQLAETAARRGFGERATKVPDALVGQPIPDTNGETFPPKSALSEDVHLVKRQGEGRDLTRASMRQEIADSLRNATETAFNDDGILFYYDKKSAIMTLVDAEEGNVVTYYPVNAKEWIRRRKKLNP